MLTPRHQPSSTTLIRRRRLTALLLTGVAVAAVVLLLSERVGSNAPSPTPAAAPPRPLEVTAGDRVVWRTSLRDGMVPDPGRVRSALSSRLPAGLVASRGPARIAYRYDLEATVARAVAVGRAGGRVAAVREAISARIAAPVIRQAQANTCESAALSILLATAGVRVSQRRLQSAFPLSGPLDPAGTGPGRTWGDPDRGYVGRPDGQGVAGGFGIYPRPVAATARQFGRDLDDLTGSSPQRLYARLLRGRAVMAWIGLSDGPYGRWQSPQGKRIDVNFGEHTVVLTGSTRDGTLRIVNPLQGTSELWSRPRFERAWQLLGRRALGA